MTGDIEEAHVSVYCGPNRVVRPRVSVKRHHDPHTWAIEWEIPPELCNQPVDLDLTYRWRSAGLLTQEELVATLEVRELHPLHKMGYEFSVTKVPSGLDSLEMYVVLPQEYAPSLAEVLIDNRSAIEEPLVGVLKEGLRILSPGQFAWTVSHPKEGRDYQVAWNPVKESQVAENTNNTAFERQFVEAARALGDELLNAFAQGLKNTPLSEQVSLALYVKRGDEGVLERIALIVVGSEFDSVDDPPEEVPLTASRDALVQAWWGLLVSKARPDSSRNDGRIGPAAQAGFAGRNEKLLFCLPLRFTFGMINPPPWGIVRVGCGKSRTELGLGTDGSEDKISRILMSAVNRLLAEALHV